MNSGQRGLFVTFEGGEGSGKSTIVCRVAEHIGERALVTQEPEGTELGRHMWEYYRGLAADGKSLTPEAELFLFAAARAEHVRTVIEPAIAAGRVVLCDRFADSTTAYQGYGRGIDLAMVTVVNRIATGGLEPDLTLLLDVPVDVGLARARALEADASKRPDAIGAESLAFHERVRAGFLTLAAAHPQRITVIDAGQPLEAVLSHVLGAVDSASRG